MQATRRPHMCLWQVWNNLPGTDKRDRIYQERISHLLKVVWVNKTQACSRIINVYIYFVLIVIVMMTFILCYKIIQMLQYMLLPWHKLTINSFWSIKETLKVNSTPLIIRQQSSDNLWWQVLLYRDHSIST